MCLAGATVGAQPCLEMIYQHCTTADIPFDPLGSMTGH